MKKMKDSILSLIKESESIALFTHENPDGDAIGSVMAFYEFLIVMNKSVDIVMDNIPPVFSFISNLDKAICKSDKKYDLAIVLDCANKERIGQTDNIFDRCKKKINIDHHYTNTDYGDINYVVPNAPACCQIVYYLFKDLNIPISLEMGEAIMTGVITDTSGFRNDNVDKDTFALAANMRDKGIDVYKIYNRTLCRKSMPQVALMRMALDRLEILHDGKIAFTYLSKEDMDNVGAKLGDHEGLVDIGRNIEGVEVSIFLREDDGYKVSLRSNGSARVNEIAAAFGGGGHVMAAGAKINMPFKETKEALIRETIKVMEQ